MCVNGHCYISFFFTKLNEVSVCTNLKRGQNVRCKRLSFILGAVYSRITNVDPGPHLLPILDRCPEEPKQRMFKALHGKNESGLTQIQPNRELL